MTQECFFHCEKCGKRLIKRLPNGLFHFAYGRKKGRDGDFISNRAPVDIYVHGSVRMRCMVDGCGHWTTFSYFPNPVKTISVQTEEIEGESSIENVDNNMSL